jgi:PAS domain S-box-containing protein
VAVRLYGAWLSVAADEERARREQNERLKLAVRAGKVGLWDWNLQTNEVHYSPEWKQQIGYGDDEIGSDFAEWESRVHPDDLPQAKDQVARYIAEPWPDYQLEFRFRHKDGSYRHILTQAALEYDDAGQPLHMYGSHIDVTQLKQSEAAQRASEARYRTLFEDDRSVKVLFDPSDGALVDANDAAAAYYGWPRAHMRTMNIWDIHALRPEEVWAEIERAQAEGRSYYLFKHRRADGTVRDVEAYNTLIELDGRQLRYAIVHDITERLRAEESLRRSEAALKRSQAIAHIGHWMWDTRSNTVTWSDEMKRIFGLDPAQFAGDLNEVIERAIHPDDAERVRAMNAAVIEEQRPVETEYRVVWPDGSVHYVLATPGDSVRDEAGGIVQLAGVVQDVTERKLRELEREQLLLQLQDQAEQLAQVMHSVPEGVLLLNTFGGVVLANPRAEEMLAVLAGYDGGEADEQRLRQLGGTALEALLTSPPLGQWHMVQAGRQIFELIARPLEAGPVPAGWVLVVREVTAARAVEEQLQRQERLAAVGQLAAGIAHDFNNIMSVISIYAELTSEVPGLTEKERARTLTIVEQAQRATRLIRQILDFSRQSVLQRQVLDLLPLLKEEEKLLRQTLPESIEMVCYCVPAEYLVQADPTRIQQLVLNLAVNARDAMPQGGQLRLALEKISVTDGRHAPVPNMAGGEWVRIEVQDTGMGIATEHLPHIFEPFFSTKEPGKGTGLGLAQAHGIVAQHGGHITVASERGVGTTFSIYLPALVVAAAPASGAGDQAALPRGRGERILVVEDNVELRVSLAELLHSLGYGVEQAANGDEALAWLADPVRRREAPVALILSDVVMPRLGGAGLLTALRRHGLAVPVILMSGHPLGEDLGALEQLGMAAWLDKPPGRLEVARAVADVLAKGH